MTCKSNSPKQEDIRALGPPVPFLRVKVPRNAPKLTRFYFNQ